MENKVLLAPKLTSLDVLVEYSKPTKLDKNVFVTVPSDYTAYFASNEVYVAKISNCKEANLLKIVGKDFKGDEVRIAFIRNIKLPLEPWGFGEMRINNDKLHLTYKLGCNGKYQLQIVNPNRLLRAFASNNSVTLQMVKEKTKPFLEPIARPIITKYFVDRQYSVFEIESRLDEIRDLLTKALTKEELFKDMGLKIKEITVNGVFIPDEDMEMIKGAINRMGLEEYNPDNIHKKDEIAEIAKEIKRLKDQIKDMKDTDTVIDEIDNLRRELLEALDRRDREEIERLQNQLKELEPKEEK